MSGPSANSALCCSTSLHSSQTLGQCDLGDARAPVWASALKRSVQSCPPSRIVPTCFSPEPSLLGSEWPRCQCVARVRVACCSHQRTFVVASESTVFAILGFHVGDAPWTSLRTLRVVRNRAKGAVSVRFRTLGCCRVSLWDAVVCLVSDSTPVGLVSGLPCLRFGHPSGRWVLGEGAIYICLRVASCMSWSPWGKRLVLGVLGEGPIYLSPRPARAAGVSDGIG